MPIPTRPIIVVCPSFNENSGGAIVLHYLVHRLRQLGVEAYAFPLNKRFNQRLPSWFNQLKHLKYQRKFKTHHTMNVPFAPFDRHQDAIVVYPEVVEGNPLNSSRVVRWLLHKPGFFGTNFSYGAKDKIFYFQHAFSEGLTGVPKKNELQLLWLRDDVYQHHNHAPRSGACWMIHKGDKFTDARNDTAILLDGKSHDEIAHIFNQTAVFYCHDPYTLYAYYAALCGCVPVVIPQSSLNANDWRSGCNFKYGVAYGEYEFEWAKETRGQLLDHMTAIKSQEQTALVHFLTELSAF